VACLAAACGLLATPGLAGAQVQPYGTNNYGTFYNILPPGTNGLDNVLQLAAFKVAGIRPAHNNDQLAMYSALTTAAPDIQASQITDYFKDATFGVPTGDVASTESPEPGVTIERDAQFGVPHIYGDTRAELMFGIGYATAEDRLFFIDALRHAGEGDLASFAGGSNVPMDESVWASTPYTQQDLENQVNEGVASLPDGQQILSDANNYVAGINAYIANAQVDPLLMPGEYAALGDLGGPTPFTVEDMVSIASLVGGIFGQGGGDQLSNAILYENLAQRFGTEHYVVPGSPQGVKPAAATTAAAATSTATATAAPATAATATAATATATAATTTATAKRTGKRSPPIARPHRTRHVSDLSGFATFMSFVDPDDPEAPTTVQGKSFPYQTLPLPSKTAPGSIALPDPGSVQFVNHVVAGAVPAGAPPAEGLSRHATKGGIGAALGPSANAGPGLFAFPRTDSNALLVSGAHTVSGHPIAVMGPQVSYFSPEILMEEDIHGPGIDADGAAFPGVNLYVELGHGPDYAWSATSAGQNIIDTFAAPLCNPSGGTPSINSNYYVLDGQCEPMQTLTRTESWTPDLADPTPAGSVTFQTQRTAFGIVIARATIHGEPVVYTNLRSTYMHELDSAQGFEMFNEPAEMRSPQDFFNAAYHVGYTFNWFYIDNQHIAYFNSGVNPVRAPRLNPLFPTWSTFPWKGYNAVTLTEEQTPESAHPQTTDPEYLTSWNNKQAPGYNDAATGQEFSSVYRSQLLDSNINAYLDGGKQKLTLVDLINAMGNAGTQDLRGVEVLPYALKIIGHPTDPALAQAVDELEAWYQSGAHRINRENPGASGNYDQSDAVRIMDAWWPLLVKAEFEPVLGSGLLGDIESDFPINDEPGHGTSGSHLGSAFDVGFYGIVQKDLRSVLGERVAGPLNRVYCGGGSLTACRAALESSLSQAIAETPQQVYPADGVCQAGDQMCSDSIQFRAIGAITQPLIEWINRPTFQQAVEIQGHEP
jgi:acyl-homoserine lactone acylase PvdQ